MLEWLQVVLARQGVEISISNFVSGNQTLDRSADRSSSVPGFWIGQPTDPDRYSMLLYPPGSVSRPIQHDTVAFQGFRVPGSVCRPIQPHMDRSARPIQLGIECPIASIDLRIDRQDCSWLGCSVSPP